jgi:carboxymethylenebutenolidase
LGSQIRLKASDGHEFDAWTSLPAAEPIAGLVVLQEAFGVNHHIRSVTEGFARDGFVAVAPALYDRLERGVELGYEGEERQRGIALARKSNPEDNVKDMAAALDFVRRQSGKRAGVIGYCYGGSMAWLAATRLDPDVAVGYYGGQIPHYAGETPRCPVMLHFGTLDAHIPKEAIDKVQAAHPEVQIFWYEAGHGFSCDERESYNAAAAMLARERSLNFLKKHLRG